MNDRLRRNATEIRSPIGTELTAKSWATEAPLRMLMNNLDPDVAEAPEDLVVYGGTGKAARNWAAYDAIVASLQELGDEETLLVQSGKPVGILKSHKDAPRVLIANSNLVGKWANWEHFRELEQKGLMMYGQMTAGSWIYIGTQGILQGTFETFAAAGRVHFGSPDLKGRLILSAASTWTSPAFSGAWRRATSMSSAPAWRMLWPSAGSAKRRARHAPTVWWPTRPSPSPSSYDWA